jgi:hypothetical protein
MKELYFSSLKILKINCQNDTVRMVRQAHHERGFFYTVRGKPPSSNLRTGFDLAQESSFESPQDRLVEPYERKSIPKISTKMLKKYLVLTFLFFCAIASLNSLDNPVFYRTPLFQGTIKEEIPEWTTGLSIRYVQGKTKNSWDDHGNKIALFSSCGPINLLTLGVGIENKKTDTEKYWKEGGGGVFPTINNLSPKDGKIDLHGSIKIREVGVTLEQSLFSGFFLQAYAPIRNVRVNAKEFKNLGQNNLNGTNVDNFIKNDLPKILVENGFAIPQKDGIYSFPTSFKKTEIPEFVLSAGWTGKDSESFNYIEELRGSFKLGCILPIGSRKNSPLAIPLGYENHFGFNARMQAEVNIWSFFVLGGDAGASVFLKKDRNIRMKTDKQQSGWLTLGYGNASVDLGSIWDIAGYIKAEKIVQGLSIILGYSFTKQERMTLLLKDNIFLKTAVSQAEAAGEGGGGGGARTHQSFVSKNEIINSDERLKGWETQTIHLSAKYDFKENIKSNFAPAVEISYDYPITGRRSFPAEMIGGSIRLDFSWDI